MEKNPLFLEMIYVLISFQDILQSPAKKSSKTQNLKSIHDCKLCDSWSFSEIRILYHCLFIQSKGHFEAVLDSKLLSCYFLKITQYENSITVFLFSKQASVVKPARVLGREEKLFLKVELLHSRSWSLNSPQGPSILNVSTFLDFF